MDEISTAAHWLRQREDETDAAWIDRLRAVFEDERREREGLPPAHAVTARTIERAWKRYQDGLRR